MSTEEHRRDEPSVKSRRAEDLEAEKLFPDDVIASVAEQVPFATEEARDNFASELRTRVAWIIGERRNERMRTGEVRQQLARLATRLEAIGQAYTALMQACQAAESAFVELPPDLQTELAVVKPGSSLLTDLARFEANVRKFPEYAAAGRDAAKVKHYARFPDVRLAGVRALASLWLDMTGKEPKLRRNLYNEVYGLDLDFIRSVMIKVDPDCGLLLGLWERICGEFSGRGKKRRIRQQPAHVTSEFSRVRD